MSTGVSHSLNVQAKAQRFDVDDLHNYSLSVQVGIRDMQLCITDSADNALLMLEDHSLEGVKSVNTRIQALEKLFSQHSLLQAGFWANVKICLKSHKFALVPQTLFAPEGAMDYLSINSEVKSKSEDVNYYKHISSDSVNVFAVDRKLIKWVEETYPSQKVQLIHQGSALVEGILKYDDHSHEKMMFCNIDRGILHVVVTLKKDILYYNQFAVRESQDYLRFVMLVFKELELNQKTTKLLLWGMVKQNSPHVALLRKYIRNISFGDRPTYLKVGYEFDEIPEHQYFDVMNVFLCD
ncbi:MAG: DUF3822 family protein [Cytophagales bacterium]|nr:DUF3822 family protein [Cytophagales bacterium]